MRSSCRGVGAQFNMFGVLVRRGEETQRQTHRGEHVTTKEEGGVVGLLGMPGSRLPPEPGERPGTGPPLGPQRVRALPTPGLWASGLKNGESPFELFRPPRPRYFVTTAHDHSCRFLLTPALGELCNLGTPHSVRSASLSLAPLSPCSLSPVDFFFLKSKTNFLMVVFLAWARP